ncbi:MAG: HAD family hydrolase [Chloroflexi bacterium]|nr:HAD family hydrolase [Chloroflexota bacterium]
MRYMALATDFDGTLASDGVVPEETIEALERLRASGRRVVLVTGRELPDLLNVMPRMDLFDHVVAENGAVLYCPASGDERLLAEPPPAEFVARLAGFGAQPLSIGRVVVSTREPYEQAVIETVREMGLELQVTFNKGAVMVLPSGVNKATGLRQALNDLGLSPHNVVAVGDAENDHILLNLAECAVAVDNALPALKERADWVTSARQGAGVRELVERLLEDDLGSLEGRLDRHRLVLGKSGDDDVTLAPYGKNVLLAGPSGSGKSSTTLALLERLMDGGYQFCLIDPEGDYEQFEGAVTLGDSERIPTDREVLQLLEQPDRSAVVNLLGIPLADRPGFLAALLPRLQELRARTARPHWLVLDEAHHLLPRDWRQAGISLPAELTNTLMITVHPDMLATEVIRLVDVVVTSKKGAEETLVAVAKSVDVQAPDPPAGPKPRKAVAFWEIRAQASPRWVSLVEARQEHRRHRRKYATGELQPDESFYFRGPQDRLNLRAQNLVIFAQMAEGVDDDTWLHHLRRHDYSRWFLDCIKDDELAAEAAEAESLADLSAADSRRRILGAIESRYTQAA